MIINMVVINNIYASTIEHYLKTNCIYLQLHQPLFMAEPLLAQTEPNYLIFLLENTMMLDLK